MLLSLLSRVSLLIVEKKGSTLGGMFMRYACLIALIFVFTFAAAKPPLEPINSAIDRNVLSQIEPGKTTYPDVVRLLGPPNQVDKGEDGEQVLVYTGSRDSTKQHVGFLFFGWTKETPGNSYRTVITLKNNIVQSLVSN